ncbi:MAG: deoxyribonuclease IV [Limnochordia bacterium]|jgi:deoxyribonuclease-4
MRIGAHLSIAKGLDKAAEMAVSIGANTFQFFTRNPRGGAARQIPAQEIELWESKRKEADIFPIVGHLPYTVNLASPKKPTAAFARQVISEDLERCSKFGAEYLVVHPGSHAGQGEEKALVQIVEGLAEIFSGFSGSTRLLLEAMAGQGSEVGSLEHLAWIGERLAWPPNLGVCLDSCHLTAAGYDFQASGGVDKLVEDLAKTVGLERVYVFHLNDSKFPPGSHKDRHALLGEGYVGLEGIEGIINHPQLRHLPFLVETPVDDYTLYAEEIRRAKGLYRST